LCEKFNKLNENYIELYKRSNRPKKDDDPDEQKFKKIDDKVEKAKGANSNRSNLNH